jgi:hypothetical protein
MKNKIIVLFLGSLLIPIHFSSAIYIPSLGTQSNPIHIQVEQDPTQLWQEAWNKINSMQYVSACSSKYDSVKSLATKNGFGNLADPYTAKSEANYLNYLYSSYQMCVTNAAQIQNQYVAPQRPKVSTQNVLDQVCQTTFGANSLYTGETNKSHGGNTGGCSCLKGYGWNNDMSKCITESKETNDLLCFNKFGVGIMWDGTKNDAGESVCACKEGYQVSTFENRCELIPIKKTVSSGGGGGVSATTVKAPSVEKTPEVNIKEKTKEDTPDITKVETVSTDTKIIPITSEVKNKSLWAKIRGWLGF